MVNYRICIYFIFHLDSKLELTWGFKVRLIPTVSGKETNATTSYHRDSNIVSNPRISCLKAYLVRLLHTSNALSTKRHSNSGNNSVVHKKVRTSKEKKGDVLATSKENLAILRNRSIIIKMI